MERCFQKRPFSFHGVAYVQEVKAGTPWASTLKRRQKRRLLRQRRSAPQRAVPADGFGVRGVEEGEGLFYLRK